MPCRVSPPLPGIKEVTARFVVSLRDSWAILAVPQTTNETDTLLELQTFYPYSEPPSIWVSCSKSRKALPESHGQPLQLACSLPSAVFYLGMQFLDIFLH
jgi:hypothetical protein